MSKGIRRPVVKPPFETKRVIVAACAAIAMVMGTMSVSSTVSSPDSAAQTGEVSAIINSETLKQKKPASADFSRKHTLEVRNFLQQQDSPLYSVPDPGPTATKNTRKALLPVFSIVSPVFFINQLTQAGQTPSPATETPAAGDNAGNTEADTPPATEAPADTDGSKDVTDPAPPEDDGTTPPTQPAEDRSAEPMSTMSTEMSTNE